MQKKFKNDKSIKICLLNLMMMIMMMIKSKKKKLRKHATYKRTIKGLCNMIEIFLK